MQAAEGPDVGANLFGALIRREVDSGSELYNNAGLFPLSLPSLSDDPRDIFNPNRRRTEQCHINIILEEKENTFANVEAISSCNEVKVVSGDTSVNVPRYLSLATKSSGLPVKTATCHIKLTEEEVNNVVLLSMKGTSSDLFRVDRKPLLVTVPGRSISSVQRYLYQVRSIFIVRALLGCACEGFTCYGADAAGLALGDQLERFLHVFDGSLASFNNIPTEPNSGTQCEEIGNTCVSTTRQDSMLVLWERTKLHRAFLCHLFAIIRPSQLKFITLDDFGRYVSGDTNASASAIEKYFTPQSWAATAGWSIFHNIVDTFSMARNTTWTIHTTPIFEHSLFRNASNFCPVECKDKAGLNLDFSRMLVTGILARQVAAPLLLELKAKLFDLDDEFYTHGSVQPDELQDSLLISIDALWCGFMKGEADSDDAARADIESEIPSSATRQSNCRRAARCVEFMLSSLAWARGRVALMLLEPGADPVAPKNGVETFHRQSAAVAMRRVRIGSLQVRDRPADRVASAGDDAESARAFSRQALVDAFRAVNPQLILPLSPGDEDLMTAVREKSEALQAGISEEIERKMHQWHSSFATLSDYYNENAVSVRSMFGKATSALQDRPRTENGVTNAPRDRVSLVQQKLDRESRQGSSEGKVKEASADLNTETFLSGPLNTPHAVSKELVEAAKDHIRAKYVALMQQVEARSSATVWTNKRQEGLSEARTELAGLFQHEAAELARLRVLKEQNSESYQRHFKEQLGVSSTPSPISAAVPAAKTIFSVDDATEAPIPSSSSFIMHSDDEVSVPPVDTKETEDNINDAEGEGVSTDFLTAATEDGMNTQGESEADLETTHGKPSSEEYRRAGQPGQPREEKKVEFEISAADAEEPVPIVESPHLPSAQPAVLETEEVAEKISEPSHSLVDIAPHLLGRSASDARSPDEDILNVVQSLAQSLLLLGSTHGLIAHSTETLMTELKELVQESPGASLDELYEALLRRAAQPVSNLHSLHSVLMRSLGRAVLTQCRAINLASLYCLINSSVDLLGHIQAVDNLLLVSPSSDFLMSLCTLMVDQHLQNVRVLHRQGGSTVSSLSPLLRCQSNANLWNNEALQVGFTSVLATATTANQWKEFGTLYASMHTSEEASTVGDSVGAITMRWTAGLFSASALASLAVQYDAPWPVPAIITPRVLEKFACITRRFLELGQLVALFRVVWGELRTKRVMTSRKKPAGRARPPQVDRQVSDSMRLVQQTVQHLFDYLSERVYVHQAHFKQAMHRASTHGLDAVVNALNTYSKGLCDAALQLSPAESAWLTRVRQNDDNTTPPGSLIAADPAVSLKTDINSMLECCRKVLSVSQSLNDANLQDGPRGDCFDGAVKTLQDNAQRIHLYRKSLVDAAKVLNANGSVELDLQPLIMRYGV